MGNAEKAEGHPSFNPVHLTDDRQTNPVLTHMFNWVNRKQCAQLFTNICELKMLDVLVPSIKKKKVHYSRWLC